MRRVTIKDISRETGLSRGTISRALNDRPDISLETKKRVMEACRKLNYMPSHAARSLATGRNYALAALVSDIAEEFTALVLALATEQAMQAGYVIHVLQTTPGNAVQHLSALAIDRIDGILNLLPIEQHRARSLAEVVDKVPLVSLVTIAMDCDVLMPDRTEAGRMAARFLFRNQRRSLLGLYHPTDGAAWASGFEEIINTQGDDACRLAACRGGDEIENLLPLIEQADGLAASDDALAAAAMSACERLGRRPGVDVAVIGCGNTPLAGKLWPALTSIDYDAREIARRAVETLLRRITKTETGEHTRLPVAPRMVERATTACCGP